MAMIDQMPSYRLTFEETVYIESEVRGIIADYLETLMFKENDFKVAVYKHFDIDEDEYSLENYGSIKSKLRGEIDCNLLPSLIDDIECIYQERMCEMYGYGVSRGYALAIADKSNSRRHGTTNNNIDKYPF